MALSQLQCLDDNHVNPRTHESKPEFLYCEDQRLALEALLQDGREAFFKYLEARGLRGFLSDPELEALSGAVEPYDPGSEIFPESAEDDEPPLSLHYWPDVSDTSIPQMDLGWPDSSAYRGVTRTTVYSQPPLDGQAHIKEVVRKMIAQAQKVIAVVMDVFTDVDIFRDLLDAGFKRRVSIYILLERTALPHFLSMCQRANMHAGHLKHLRVRCTEGPEFYTRSSTKVVGRMGHRFMFIDGDKAVSGSYNFTWMSSRLDRNLITVVTGQAVDAFDRLFHILYVTSRLVDLRQVAKAPEPEPDPLPQPTSVAPPSAAVARKLYNPKYALVTLGNLSPCPSPTPSTGHNSPKNNSGNPEVPDAKKRTRRRASKDTIQDAPPIHPGLINLEKAYLISYLPTWPEPDPPSDVIGFINIRDASKPNQVHLQRSEMFETSQAIRFSSPFNMPKEKLPEVAKPRLLTNKDQKMNKLQPAQDKTKAKELVVDRARAPEQNPPTSGPKCESDRDTTKLLNTEDKLHSSTPTNLDAGHSGTRHLNAHTTPQCSGEASTPNTGRPSHTTQVATTNNPNLDSLSGSKTKKEETSLNKQRAIVFKTHILELNSTLTSHLQGPTGTNTGQHTQRLPPHTDSHTQAAHTQPKNSSEMTPNIQTDTVKSSASPSSTSLSENKHVSNTKSMATSACAPLSSIPTLLTSSSTTLNPPLPSSLASSSLTSPLPIPKPRTLQLVVTSDGQKLPEFSVMRRQKTSAGLQVLCNEPAVQKQKSEKESETVTELHNNSGSRPVVQKDADRQNIGKIRESPQQKQSGTSQKTKDEEAVGLRDDRAGMHLEVQSEVLITDAPKSKSANIREISPKDVEAKTLTSIDCKLTPQTDCVATVQAGIKATERALTGCEVPNENNNNVTQHKSYYASALERQRKLYYTLTPKDIDVLVTVDSLKGATLTSVPASHTSEDITGDSTHTPAADAHGQQGYPSFTPAHCTDSMPNTAKHNTHSNFQELIPNARASTHTPEKSLRLHLPNTHMPDLRSQTPEREAWSVAALVRTPTPEGFLPCTPTPDSRTHTPDLRSYTPDFRTPTSDGSDGYFSARADSALSTASEEYYECTDSPLHEPVFDLAAHRNHGTTEDHVSFTHTSTPNTTTLATSPIYMKYNTGADTLVTTDRNNSSSETQTLSGPTSVSSLSSLPEEKVKTRWEEEAANEENVREVDEKGRKLSVAEGRTEGDPQGTQRKDSEEAKRIADPFKQVKDLMDTVEKNKEAQPQSLKRKMVPNQSAAERLVDRGVTLGELTNERAEPKRLSTGDLKPKKAPSEGERPDKEKAVDRAALGPSGVEKRGRLQSSRETEGQKVLHTPPRTPRGLQQDSGVVPPSRPSKSPRPLSGAHPSGSRQPNQTESKVLQGQGLNTTSSPRKQPSRLSPPAAAGAVGLVAGRKQAELVSRQPPAAQGRAKTAQSPNQHPLPKPPASFLHTHSNALLQLHPHSQNQAESAKEVHSQEDGKTPFSFTLSKLYSLKDLKMSKLPAQSKRGSTSSPVQGHKSTS